MVSTTLAALLGPSGIAAKAAPLHVTLDPGHGGPEVGASFRFADGLVLQEKALTLRVALRLRDLLEQAGYSVTLTRSTDAPVNLDQRDLNGDGRVGLADDLQARVDRANRASSDIFVSIHFNGASDPSVRGTYTFWNPRRPFADRSQRLAELVQAGLVSALRRAGHPTLAHGARTDASVLGGDAFFLLGPRSSIVARPSQMPAIIGEPLFLTNPQDAAALRDERVVEAVARGYFEGIQAFAATPPPAVDHPAPAAAPQWTVWAVTYQDTPRGQLRAAQAAQDLRARGVPASVLDSSRVASLWPGFLIVTSGRFATRKGALAQAARVRAAGFADAYARAGPPE